MNEMRIDTVLGEMRLLGDSDALAGIYFVGQKYEPAANAAVGRGGPALQRASEWLQAYFAGANQGMPAVQLAPRGSEFQRAVWRALDQIPPGQLHSYGALAAQLGRPGAARAVGAAVGRNPWSVLRPCHRVTGGDGALTGYAGGLGRKQALLAIEAGMGLPWRTVLKAYHAQYKDPIQVPSGATVQWVERADEGEFSGWKWAEANGRGGWVPRAWFGPGAQQSNALRSVSARELDVELGDQVLLLDSFSGWNWVRSATGQLGWIPLGILS